MFCFFEKLFREIRQRRPFFFFFFLEFFFHFAKGDESKFPLPQLENYFWDKIYHPTSVITMWRSWNKLQSLNVLFLYPWCLLQYLAHCSFSINMNLFVPIKSHPFICLLNRKYWATTIFQTIQKIEMQR